MGLSLSCAVFIFLTAARNLGVLGYLFRSPSAFTLRSLGSILEYGLLPVSATALLGLAAWGSGRHILRRLMGRADVREEPLTRICALGLGIGAIAYSVFLLGLAGGLTDGGLAVLGLFWLLLAAPSISAIPALEIWRARKKGHLSGRDALMRGLCLGLLAFAAWHALILALAPPTEWDVLAYHLAIPKLYLSRGKIFEVPWMIHSHWPHLMETFYCLPLALGMDNMAALIHASVCAAWVWAVFASARKFLDAPAARLAAVLLAAQPLLLRFAGTAHSDGAWAFFHFLCAVCVWSWSLSGEARWLLLGGLFGGLGASCKLLGVIPFAALGLWILLHPPRARNLAAWRSAALFWMSGLAVVAPWYAKAYIGSGNPIWPFLPAVFGGRWGGPLIEPAFARSNYWAWPPDSGLLSHYGPIFLLLPTAVAASAAFLRRAPWPKFIQFLWYPVPFYLPFLIRHNELWRFLLPFFPAMALTAAWFSSRRGNGFALLAFFFGLVPAAAVTQNNQLFSALGLHSLREPGKDPRTLYRERSLKLYAFCDKVNGLLAGQPAKVLLFREIRGYPLDMPYQWGDPVNQGLISYDRIRDPDELRGRLLDLGITYVLVNEELAMYQPGRGYYDARTAALMEAVLLKGGRRALSGDGFVLYRLL